MTAAKLNEHQSSLEEQKPSPPSSSPLPSSPSSPSLPPSLHPYLRSAHTTTGSSLPPGGTKLSGVRGTLRLDKMLQNDRDNNDNEFHVFQSWNQRCLTGLTCLIKLLQVRWEIIITDAFVNSSSCTTKNGTDE